MKRKVCVILLFFAVLHVAGQTDSEPVSSVEEMSKKRQDPVAGLRSIFLQDILLPVGEGTANSFSIQPVFPFKIAKNVKLITYTIIPFQTLPPLFPGDSKEGGMGNILFNGYFSPIEKKGKLSWGIGPAIQLPTRTNSALGSNTVAMGPTGLLYYAGDKITGGVVVQNYWSLGGNEANKVNSFSMQYIGYYNLPKGWFIESNATIIANWLLDSNKWLVPIGGGPGKTFKMGKLYYCWAAQLFYNVAKPELVGNWQAVFQLQVIL